MLLLDVVKALKRSCKIVFKQQPYIDVVTQDSDASPCRVMSKQKYKRQISLHGDFVEMR